MYQLEKYTHIMFFYCAPYQNIMLIYMMSVLLYHTYYNDYKKQKFFGCYPQAHYNLGLFFREEVGFFAETLLLWTGQKGIMPLLRKRWTSRKSTDRFRSIQEYAP